MGTNRCRVQTFLSMWHLPWKVFPRYLSIPSSLPHSTVPRLFPDEYAMAWRWKQSPRKPSKQLSNNSDFHFIVFMNRRPRRCKRSQYIFSPALGTPSTTFFSHFEYPVVTSVNTFSISNTPVCDMLWPLPFSAFRVCLCVTYSLSV